MKHLLLLFLFITSITVLVAQEKAKDEKEKLVVIWSSADPEVAEKVCFMYTHAARKYEWFEEVRLVIWGPSAKLILEDKKLQEKLKQMQKDGVVLEACIVCAKMYNAVDGLKKLGADVKGMGAPLTSRLKEGWRQLNF